MRLTPLLGTNSMLIDQNFKKVERELNINANDWHEIARSTLTVAGDTIVADSIPAVKYLKIVLMGIASGGTLDTSIRFNNDTGTNYAGRWDSGGAHATSVSQTALPLESGSVASAGVILSTIEILNIATSPKIGVFNAVGVTTVGAGTAPTNLVGSYEWVNTSAQINRIDFINGGTGNFAVGSEIIVMGKN